MQQHQTTPTNIYKEHQWLRQMLLSCCLIRSYYPKLTASQVKHILMDSGVVITTRNRRRKSKDSRSFHLSRQVKW
jgi:hypothetical protein